MGTDGAIHAGMQKLITDCLARNQKRGGHGLMEIDRRPVDSRYWPVTRGTPCRPRSRSVPQRVVSAACQGQADGRGYSAAPMSARAVR